MLTRRIGTFLHGERTLKIDFTKVELIMARKEKGLSDLAKKMHLTRQRLYSIKKGANDGVDFGTKLVGKLARGLGVDVQDIISDTAPLAQGGEDNGQKKRKAA
jgi:DNA-binding Xre family transcriptional regulator